MSTPSCSTFSTTLADEHTIKLSHSNSFPLQPIRATEDERCQLPAILRVGSISLVLYFLS